MSLKQAALDIDKRLEETKSKENEIRSFWKMVECPVCGGEMSETMKNFCLIDKDIFRKSNPHGRGISDYTLDTRLYSCKNCGCIIFRKK